jgi:hypothetical protein
MAVIFEKYKIAFFNVPKIASTSVKHAFYTLEHGRPFKSGDHGAIHIHQIYKRGFYLSTSPIAKDYRVEYPLSEKIFDELDDYWKFAIVRDPAKRILSAYTNRVLYHRDLHEMPNARKRAFKYGLTLTPTVDSFLSKIERYRKFSISIKRHTDPIFNYLGNDLSRYDAVYRVSELPQLAQELSARTGPGFKIPHLQTSEHKIHVNSLCKRSYDRLMEYTASEYDFLENYYTRPSPGPAKWNTRRAIASIQSALGAVESQFFNLAYRNQ